MGGDGAKDILKVAALGGLAATGFGAAGMGPLAGMMGTGGAGAAGALGAGEAAAGVGAADIGGMSLAPWAGTSGGAQFGLPGMSMAPGAGAAAAAPWLAPASAGLSPELAMRGGNLLMQSGRQQPQQQGQAPGAPAPQLTGGAAPASFAQSSPFMQPWWKNARR
jgi:hypothetical protein